MTDFEAVVRVAAGTAALATAAELASTRTITAVRNVAGALRDLRGVHDDHHSRAERLRRAHELLGLRQPDEVFYRSDNTHALFPDRYDIHPDNRIALTRAAGGAFREELALGSFQVAERIPATLDAGLVLLGSAASEGLSRLLFGYREVGEDSLALDDPPVDLPFRFMLDRSRLPDGATAGRYVADRGRVLRPLWYIETSRGPLRPLVGPDGMLRTDYLVVTRLPNYLSAAATSKGQAVVAIGGTHGVGTRAVSLLMRDEKALLEVADIVGTRERAFQAVFEVSDIDHDPVRGSFARRIAVHTVEPLDERAGRWETAAAKAAPRVREWLVERAG